ncbi:MAG: YceI family protein [Acidobacteriota bacterium]|nr:YceI family protein [Acidobacteriota bacterium]
MFALVAVLPAAAQQAHVVLDTNATKVNFTLSDVLHTVHGVFRLTKGDFWVDPPTGKAGGEMIVGAATGDSGSHSRDGRMKKNILQTDQYSEITFRPDRIDGNLSLSGDSAFKLHGLFTIHGAAHELTMNVKSHIEAGRVAATADFDVPYVQWGMKDPSTLFLRVNNAVTIDIEAVGRTQ